MSSFIQNIRIQPKISICSKNIEIYNSDTFLSGFDIGIPLNIFQNIFTNIHYGYDITTPKLIILQFLVGYYTYGKDRYSDAIEYIKKPYNTDKKDLYNFINDNKNYYKITILSSFYLFTIILLSNPDDIEFLLPFTFFLLINGEYKSYKQYLNTFKPIYIGIMWTIATVILPCILYEHNYNIINYPNDYIPCFLTLFATSNFADEKDIEEDKINNINTIPVKYGIKVSNSINIIALIISIILFMENKNFGERLLINSIFEIQNFATIGLLLNSTLNN